MDGAATCKRCGTMRAVEQLDALGVCRSPHREECDRMLREQMKQRATAAKRKKGR